MGRKKNQYIASLRQGLKIKVLLLKDVRLHKCLRNISMALLDIAIDFLKNSFESPHFWKYISPISVSL